MLTLPHDIEQNESFAEDPKTDDFEYSHTKIILKDGDRYYYATTRERFHPGTTANPQALSLVLIPSYQIWPPFPLHFTQAPMPLPEGCYVKRPSLLDCGDGSDANRTVSSLLLGEAEKCEILRKHPHPNIPKYFGCLVRHGRITGLCFTKYDMTLAQRLEDPRPLDAKRCLKGIEDGVRHIHGLGLIHCDINPHNIMMDGDTSVIIDYDSCRRNGEELGIKVRTVGWTKEDFEPAELENDLYGIEKIRRFIEDGNY